MRLSELFLRIGCALVAWMVLFAHFVWLAAVRQIECGPNSDEMYRLLLILLPFTLAAAFLVRLTRPFADVHSMLRWLGLPLAGLMLVGAYNVWLFARGVYFLKLAPCHFGDLQTWHSAWVPAQVIVILVVASAIATDSHITGRDPDHGDRILPSTGEFDRGAPGEACPLELGQIVEDLIALVEQPDQ